MPLRTDIFVKLGAAPLRCSRVRVLIFCNQGRMARSSTTCSEQKTRTLENRKGAAPNFASQIKFQGFGRVSAEIMQFLTL
jgi:hypothetical protein